MIHTCHVITGWAADSEEQMKKCVRRIKWLTCEVISHRSWPLCSVPSAAWSKSPALCKGSPTPTLSQCTSEPKHENTFKYVSTPSNMFWKKWRKKIASLRRWGFLWSVSGGSLWRLPHCCNFPAGQSPAPRPCPGRLRRSPSPGALFLQHPPPVGRERRRKETRNKVRCGWDERMYALIHNLR